MKTKLILVILFNIAFLNSFAQKKPTKAEIEASNIILLVNTVTDLRNAYLQDFQSSSNNILSIADSNLKKYQSNPNVQLFYINCDNVLQINPSLEKSYDKEAAKTFTFTEKSSITAAVNIAKETTKELEKACKALSDYFSNKDFTSDKDFINYNALTNNYVEAAKKFQSKWLETGTIGAEAANKAELTLIKRSPIADFVIPMKSDLFVTNQILDMLNSDEPDISSIESKLSNLKTAITQNKDIKTKDTAKLSDVYYREVYTTFYRKLETSLDGISKLVTRFKNNNIDESIKSLLNNTYQAYDDAVNSYNTFISQ